MTDYDNVMTAAKAKANAPSYATRAKATLAGMCISLGCAFMACAKVGSALGPGPTGLMGGLCFSVGLLMVVRCGGELFTGDMLMTVGCLGGGVRASDTLHTWAVVYLYNAVGAMLVGAAVAASGIDLEPIRAMADAKCALSWGEALSRGILCNFLVCAAVWMGTNRDNANAFVACLLPVACFVTCGFEHSVANMFVLLFARTGGWAENLLFVTIGNVIGGVAFSLLQHAGEAS